MRRLAIIAAVLGALLAWWAHAARPPVEWMDDPDREVWGEDGYTITGDAGAWR
jgi:hypothetical protein